MFQVSSWAPPDFGSLNGKAMLKSSYFFSQAGLLSILHMFSATAHHDVILMSGTTMESKDAISNWFLTTDVDTGPICAIYFEHSHFVPMFNLNVKRMKATLEELKLSANTHSIAPAANRMLPNGFVVDNLAQGDCAPNCVRLFLMVRNRMRKDKSKEEQHLAKVAEAVEIVEDIEAADADNDEAAV